MSLASSSQTPLPFTQIAILMCVRLAEPISYTVIFPFINQMVEELGVTDNPDKVGFYSGLVESVFAFVQFFTVYHWAKLSDRIGRKPVILMGLSGVALSGAFFGLSTSFWMMIAIRSISGALNGNVAVVKAAIGDITDESNSTEAFAMYGLTWTVGSIIGNAMGGTLSHPCENFPSVFGDIELFRVHPYLLPCIVSASLTVIGILFTVFKLKESLPPPSVPAEHLTMRLLPSPSTPRHKHNGSLSNMSEAETLVGSPVREEDRKDIKFGMTRIREEGYSDDDDDDDDAGVYRGMGGNDLKNTERLISKMPQGVDSPGFGGSEKRGWGFWALMRYRPMQILSTTMFLNSFVNGSFGAVSLVFFFDKRGGLGMTTQAIGYAMSLQGLCSIFSQLLLLNRIRRWLGISKAYKTLTAGWIIVFLLLPTLRTLLEWSEEPLPSNDPNAPLRYAETRGWPVSIGVNALLSLVTIVGMSSSLLMVLINFASPDRTALGAVNGIATAVGCMSRVLGPSSVSALFALSMDEQILGGRLWWIFMSIMATLNFITCLMVSPDGKASAPPMDEEQGPESP